MSNTEIDPDALHWAPADGGYSVALAGAKLVCRNKKGKLLASVPSKVRKGEMAQQLLELREWLKEHEARARQQVEAWMLRSLPVPRGVVQAVWADPAWRKQLENAVACPTTLGGAPELDEAGFLKGVDEARGVGVVNQDGETEWLDAELLSLPHPILLPELEDWRELSAELGLSQGIDQLFRETFPRPTEAEELARTAVRDFVGGTFAELRHAVGRCRSLGYPVRGGFAVCPVWEGGRQVEARYWIGVGEGYEEAWTEELVWMDAKEQVLTLAEMGPVTYSEGVRMASRVYAGRVVKKEGEE